MLPKGMGQPVQSGQRDHWLRLDDTALLAQCDLARFRASGPGGQRRNKVETGVRLMHRPSGLSAQAAEGRSPEGNRSVALGRLRLRMALELREAVDPTAPALAPEFVAQRGPGGSIAVNPRNPAYSIVIACVLDALAAVDGRFAGAAAVLGVTSTQLRRLLEADREVWRAISPQR